MNDIQKNLITKINLAANIIAKKSRSSEANYIIVSPEIAEIIENLDIRIQRRKKLQKIAESIKSTN